MALLGASAPDSTLITVLVALLGGGLVGELGRVYMRWRKGPINDALQMQQAQELARRASAELFTSYRVELEDAKQQLSQYLDQLLKVQRDLGAAEARILKLEEDLRAANVQAAEAKQLRTALDEAITRREELQSQVAELRDRIHALEQIGISPRTPDS